MMKEYGTVIIGGGPAGYKAAEKIAEGGSQVCIIDTRETRIGGTCLNEGCVPAKSLIRLAGLLRKSGTLLSNSPESLFNEELRKKFLDITEKNMTALRSALVSVLKKKGVEFIFGKASFKNAETLIVDTGGHIEEIRAGNIIIASGSRPKEISFMKSDGDKILDSSQLMKKLPEADRIVFVGAGYIGCEFACLYSNLGAEVTIIEECNSILPSEEGEVARTLARELKKRGVRILTGTRVSSSEYNGKEISVTLEGEGKRIDTDVLCVTIGRAANIDGLHIENAGVDIENGCIKVDDNMCTSAGHIYAAGDVINSPMLAYTAYREGEIAAASILKQEPPALDYRQVPGIIFTEPEIGCVGHTEESAREIGLDVRMYKSFFKANARAVIADETAGFCKVVIDNSEDRIIGAQMIGPDACELIHILTLAVTKGLTMSDLQNTVFAHPVLAEVISGLS